MLIPANLHLTYCSNIHAGELWSEVFDALKKNVPSVKKSVSPHKSFGIGLRLSDVAAKELLSNNHLADFKIWLKKNDCYVFTMNGFPFGGFHNTIVKDEVYKPDWTKNERVLYTINLIKILAALIPENSEAGISTSPLSYKKWFDDKCNVIDVYEASCINLIKCVVALYQLRKATGKYIHLDIEPEPDCLLENTNETIDFFNKYLIPYGADHLQSELNLSKEICNKIIRDHITVCYDVCHFAVEFEEAGSVIQLFEDAGIKIGKVQISSALKVVTDLKSNRKKLLTQYKTFEDSTYLHQTVVKDVDGNLHHYNDLPQALENFGNKNFIEWRTHYHVPVYTDTYNDLKSTQNDILTMLEILKQNKFTSHLEVETYTWEVLPKQDRLEIKDSIVRELQWVINELEK